MSVFEQKFQTAVRHFQSGRLEEAQIVGRELLKDEPRNATLLQLLGEIAMRQGNGEVAETLFRQAVDNAPQDPHAHYRLGNILFSGRRIEAAAQCYDRAIGLKPDYWQCQVNLGLLRRSEGRFQDARQCFEQALKYNPGLTTVSCYLLDLLLSLGELSTIKAWSGQIQSLVHRCISDDRERDFAALMYLAPLLSISRQDYRALSGKMDRLLRRNDTIALQNVERAGGRKLRIGYLSTDFGDHPISHVMRGVFGEHAREQFEIIAYSINTRTGDIDREYIQTIRQNCDDYVDLSALTVQQAAQRIAADGIGILVNLAGYMSPPSLEICAWRPAPVQVYWLGHGGGLGLSFIDYVIADKVVVPYGEEVHYRENIVRMPDSYHCADTPSIPDLSPSRAEFGLDDNAFVFCAFNNPNKIDSAVFDSWMNILKRVPGSQLWLSNPGGDDTLVQNLRAEAGQRGVDPERLVFATRIPDKSLHFVRHRLADLFLDTFVYNASTTAIDALWSGLPVLTRPGNDFCSRICATHVINAGLDDMVCDSTRAFEDRAVYFARNAEALSAVSERLARNIRVEPLFDQPRFVRHLENAYLGMWQRYLSGKAPESFDVQVRPPAYPAGTDQ